MQINDRAFFSKVKNSKKILVLDLGFLGDTLQLIPALRTIRKALPKAQLHVMVSSHITSILELTPWVDQVIGYPRFPKRPSLISDIPRLYKLFKQKYDLVINLTGSQRSCYLTWATGANYRLGRMVQRPFFLRKFCFTDCADFPYGTMHIAKQRCELLHQAGFPDRGVSYDITVPGYAQKKIQTTLPTCRSFVHISPFSSLDFKELPLAILAEFIDSFCKNYPHLPYVISCAPTEREKNKLEALLKLVKTPPLHAYKGTLSALELVALIQKCVLHIGADSGPMHIAMVTQVPCVAWFREDPVNYIEWMPHGSHYRSLIGKANPEGLQGISVLDVFNACKSILL